MFKNLILIISVFSLLSCSSQKSVSEMSCDEMLKNNPQIEEVSVKGKAGEALGTVLSYSLAGLGYTTDIVLHVGAGIVICSPVIALESAFDSRSMRASQDCFRAASSLEMTSIGESAYKKTRQMRCPDYTPFTQDMRLYSSCLASKKDARALENIENIIRNDELYGCLPSEERIRLHEDLKKYKSLIN